MNVHSVRIKTTKLLLVGTRITYQAIEDAVLHTGPFNKNT